MALPFQNYTFIADKFAKGGINTKSALTDFKDNESPYCSNVVFTQDGAVIRRNGFSKLNFTQITGAPNVLGIYQHQKSDGTECIIIGAGDTIYDDPQALTPLIAGQDTVALYDFASLNNYAFIVNGVDANLKYDCVTISGLGLDPPGAAPTFVVGGAGNVNAGAHDYVYTFVDGDGFESNPSPVGSVVLGVNSQVTVNITVSADPTVVDRNIYRSTAGGTILYLVGNVGDNVAVVFLDNVADANLGAEVEYDNDKPPILRYIETHKNRIFGIPAANKSRLVFSKPLAPGQMPALNFIDISPNDGDNITGIVSFFDQLVIFKRETIYVLSGNDETDFIVQRAQSDSRVGCVAFRTIAVVDNQVAFLSERGVYSFDGLRTHYISGNLEALFSSFNPNIAFRFNWSSEDISCAVNYKNRSRTWYWLNIPTGSVQSNFLGLIYDYTMGIWTIAQGINASSIAIVEEQNQPVVYSGDYNGFLWKQDITSNDGFLHVPSYSTSNTNGVNTLRDESQALFLGTATAGGANTLTDNTLTMTVNEFVSEILYIEAGTGAGQFRTIASNTADTFTVTVPWGVVPDATSQYIVGGWVVNAAMGVRVKIIDGLGKGQIRLITSNTPVEFTVSVNWTTIPTTLSKYSIGFIEAEWQSRWFHYNAPEYVKRLMYVHVNANREGNYDLVVGLRFDFFTGDVNSVLKSLALSGADSVWDQSIWDVDTWDQVSLTITRLSNDGGRIHRYVQVLFRNDAGGEPWQVNSFDLVYQVKGVRR